MRILVPQKSLMRLLIYTAIFLGLPSSGLAQTNTAPSRGTAAPTVAAATGEGHFIWTEGYDGSSDSDGQVMVLDNTAGYAFGKHLAVTGGIPVYFVRAATTNSTGASTTNSFSSLGDIYARVRLDFPNPLLNFRTQLTGTAPTGSTSHGISSGHATYDWTSRVDRDFGNLTPFLEAGLANAIPEAFVYRRPFTSRGDLGHFQAGFEYQIFDTLGFSASGFDIAPWGTQTIVSRLLARGVIGRGNSRSPVFQQNSQTTGGASLAADNGFAVGADFAPVKTMDFSVEFDRSTHYHLNTVSFGVAINMWRLLHPTL